MNYLNQFHNDNLESQILMTIGGSMITSKKAYHEKKIAFGNGVIEKSFLKSPVQQSANFYSGTDNF